jgi:hypothetical protein
MLANEVRRDHGRIFEYSLIEALILTSYARKNANNFFRSQLDPIDLMCVDFMAEIFPDEGLDVVLGQWPKDTTRLSTMYLFLFSSQTASTVITSGQVMNDITESAWTNYARQSLAAATWGAQAAGTGGRKSTYPQVTYPTVGASGGTVNGFGITDISGTSGDKAIAVANFDDTTAVVLATNDVIKVTPTVQFNN